MLITKPLTTRSLIMIGCFAALIFLGIQSFRIPMPAVVGTPFLHFGHIFVVLAVICLGPKYSAAAGILGFVAFDLLNGYVPSIPNVVFSTLINCLIVGSLFVFLTAKKTADKHQEYRWAILCACLYGLLNIVIDYIWSVVELMLLGSSFFAASAIKIASIPATAINSVFTIIGIVILYYPVKNALRRIMKD